MKRIIAVAILILYFQPSTVVFVKKKTDKGAEWLLLTRAEDGSIEYAISHPDEATPDERKHNLWVAPTGPECLKKHPEVKEA